DGKSLVRPELVVCGPSLVTHFPGTVPGACFVGPHSPWSPPLAPPTPQRTDPPCSSASWLLWRSPTSRFRTSSASTPRLPDADQCPVWRLARPGAPQLPVHSFCAGRGLKPPPDGNAPRRRLTHFAFRSF